MQTRYDFTDQVVLITGAASGFGELAAQRFAQAGARLALGDINADAVQLVADKINANGGDVLAMACDVSSNQQVEAFVAACVKKYGRLDIGINNAGISHPKKRLHQLDESNWDQTNGVNQKGVFLCMKYELTQMVEQESGVILNVASAAGLMGSPFLSLYSSGKHGVIGLTKSAALEYGKMNIRVNAICPAFAKTPLVENSLKAAGGKSRENLMAGNPMKRLGEVEEIVQAMLWACSKDNSFMNGAVVPLDGGLAAS
ncbi:MAG: glucose 1-dehydrogenase [Gammaproteobacteria bacterium]|nr:glucose 1-dehydrogenase [Gammaproteobacteria bacterium]MBQ0840916.1 glucose 1-dehydrogenase [Gammaproteobacteria bacterium]